MKRKKTTFKTVSESIKAMSVEKKVRYQKITGGTHYLKDKTQVKKGDIITVFPHEIPEAFKADFNCLDTVELPKDFGIKIGIKPSEEEKGKWEVVNVVTGEKLNDAPLSAEEARAFLQGDETLEELENSSKNTEDSSEE